jgi:hypothetical protein
MQMLGEVTWHHMPESGSRFPGKCWVLRLGREGRMKVRICVSGEFTKEYP